MQKTPEPKVERSRLTLLAGLSSTAAAGLCAQYTEGPSTNLNQVMGATSDGINATPAELKKANEDVLGGEGGEGGGGGSH